MKNFSELGIRPPHVLLPSSTPISRWAVIACDQYTQDKNYWEKVKAATNGSSSTYDLILPEIFLGRADKSEYIKQIHQTMKQYIDTNIFAPETCDFIYLERKTSYGRTRCGVIAELDLESYDWHPEAMALVRATEATIPERIPPRKEIRKGAPLEAPHIMLLVNDSERIFVEAIGAAAKTGGAAAIYDGELMMNGGSIKGWKVPSGAKENICAALNRLAEKNTDASGKTFLFAVGDGNHSLATAKAVWDDYKKTIPESEWASSNVRYALVEIVNLFDAGLTFEPIHRVVFGAKPDALINQIAQKLGGTVASCESFGEMAQQVSASNASFGFVYTENGETHCKLMRTNIAGLAVAQFQPVLDAVLADAKASGAASASAGASASASQSASAGHSASAHASIDFIHGTEEVERLGKQDDATAILLPPIAKDSFFDTIRDSGVLPRKSFSMGEADEKRFYLECRKLFG